MAIPEKEHKFHLQTGTLTLEQLNLMMGHLPMEVTFVDEKDRVVYYSAAQDGMFPRSQDVLGGSVVECHSAHNHEKIRELMESFRKGERKFAEQWVERDGKTFYIWYLPMHDEQGVYRGTIEAALDVTLFMEKETGN